MKDTSTNDIKYIRKTHWVGRAVHTVHVINANFILLVILVLAGVAFHSILTVDTTLRFWIIIPILLYPYWLEKGKSWDRFLWTKIPSLIPIGTVWCTIARAGLVPTEWIHPIAGCILGGNIAEAVVKDLVSGYRSYRFTPINAVSGALIIAKMIPKVEMIQERQYVWHLGKEWVAAYTIWNFILVYNNYEYALGRHTAVLLAPIIIALFYDEHGLDCWAQNRTYTLAFYFVIRNTFYRKLRSLTDVSLPSCFSNYKFARNIEVASFLIIWYLLVYKNGEIQAFEVDTSVEL
jgi:hypothetical protein